ncbi:MAG TPA: Hpt domain-containing protein [Pseudomonadales bacterium]
MATSREHFALDWIRSELLETLSSARARLEEFAEGLDGSADGGHGREALRECVNELHQVHGTLVMLELKGVTLLADHLERLAEQLAHGRVSDVAGASQSLMQGILELPGHLDELRAGLPDSDTAVRPLVNELRRHLGEPPLEGAAVLGSVADEAAIRRFRSIDGVDKTRKIRAVYQQVLLTLLKGGDLADAVGTLRKVAQGMSKICEGAPHAAEWQAFGEFVEALALVPSGSGPLDGNAVKLLRRVDSEIRELVQTGEDALRRPVPVALVRQLLDAAAERGRRSATLDALLEATAESDPADSLALSGRQALISAAAALREELGTVKDRLDLFVRAAEGSSTQGLGDLLAPLKQIASTLSLLGFESSRSIVLDQIEALGALIAAGRADESAILNVAGALVQVDENLASLTQTGRGEAEKITDEAQRAVAQQIRADLDQVKQSIVDYVSSQWDVRHLQEVPGQLDAIHGALRMIPLAEAAEAIRRCRRYLHEELMAGHVPTWEELDRLADAVSGIDYYLERLASENPGGADDVLDVVRRSLDRLEATATAGVVETAQAAEAVADAEPAAVAERGHEAPVHHDEPEPPTLEPEPEEPTLELEADEDFDLGSALFDELAEPDAEPASASDASAPDESDPLDDVLDLVGAAPEPAATEPAAAEPIAATSADVPVLPGLVDSFESDDEIVEIFVEEVDEVLAAVDEQLPEWEQNLADEHRQTEIRRAFHTLKGSGRMVGANVLGEMAWSVENMLNRVLDGTVPPTPEFVAVVREARALVPLLKQAFERRVAPDMAPVARLIEQADVLASGGSLSEAGLGAAAALPAEPAIEPGPEPSAEASPPAAEDEDRLLFVTEAEGHLQRLGAAVRGETFVLDDDSMRALHTLSGSAAMAGLEVVRELAAPAYELAQVLRRPGTATTVSGEAAEFFRQFAAALAAMVADLRAGREPEEPFQLIADVDRLLMEAESAGGASGLLASPALEALVKAHELLDAWRDGSVDLTLADEVRAALGEVERIARAEEQGPIARLAGALLGAHERFEFESLGAGAAAVLGRAHDALLAQLDALAADQSPADEAALVQALQGLQPGPEAAPAAPEADHVSMTEDEPVADAIAADARPSRETPFEPDDFELELEPVDLPEPEEIEAVERQRAVPEEPAAPAARAEPARPPQPVPPAADERPAPAVVPATAEGAPLVPDEVDQDIIAVFFEEADEILEGLDHGISDWSDERDNRLHLENLLRGLHTLKGGARLAGLTALGDATHELESFLIDFQNEAQAPQDALFDRLQARYDALATLLAQTRAALAGGPAPAHPAPTPAPEVPVEPARPVVRHDAPPESDASEAAPPPARVTPLRPAASKPRRPAPAAETRAEAAAAQARNAQEMVRVGAGLLESLVNLAGESSIIRARVEQGMSDFTAALDEMETTIERLREQLRRLEIETEAQILFRQERLDGPAYEDFDPLEMDRYSQLQQLSRALGESASDMLDLKETLLFKAREAETLLLQQARVNTELQEGLMRSRMVPFSRLLPRLRRTVRQVAKELGKEVELYAHNVEGELDRSLLERMVPPLEHMLRNAVDHGIEQRERRRASGKAEAGRIDLRLSREGGDVVIEIADDGAGIDVDRVRAKAIERGLMAPDADLADDEISQFVLAPGFSTASTVTQISGRGVGMDVVHSEVKQLGGSIDIHSERGRGTRFVLRVPFTVSVNRALMVAVGDDLYAIPLNTIEGIVLLAPDELERLYAPDGTTFEYAGVPYRVQYLGSFLGREYHPQPMQGSVPVVLVRSGEHAVAVHVDAVQGSREIVVKSLGPQFAGVGGISGATILGDGSVVVILDLLALIRTRAGGVRLGKRALAGAPKTRCVMVVDDSVTVRKVTSRLLERQGMDVVVAKDGVEAVSLLQERRPDVMLLDIEMPRMDGFEVLRQVRHDERLRDLPVVMISSRTGAKHQDRAAELGVNRFLGKPFQENELLATIDELVG